MRKHLIYIILLGIVLVGCKPEDNRADVFGMIRGASVPVNQRFEQSINYNEQHHPIVRYALAETYHLALCADTHIDTNRTNFETFIKDYHADILCPIAIHLGDWIDAQGHWDYALGALQCSQAGLLKITGDTLFGVVGNHDLFFGQWDAYQARLHSSVYRFVVRTPLGQEDLYIVLDSGEGTLGSLQTAWLKKTLQEAEQQDYRHIIVCSHTHLFKTDLSQGLTSNFALEESYALLRLLAEYQVDLYLCGHDHHTEECTFDGVRHIVVGALQAKQRPSVYMKMSIGQDIQYQVITVE